MRIEMTKPGIIIGSTLLEETTREGKRFGGGTPEWGFQIKENLSRFAAGFFYNVVPKHLRALYTFSV